MDFTINRFYNEQKGLFSFNQSESNELFTRKFELMDNVIPSSNSSIANSLFLLSQIYEMEKYKKTAEKMLSSVKDKMVKYPSAFSNWGILAMNIVYPFYSLAVCGENAIEIVSQLNNKYLPRIIKAGSRSNSEIPLLKDRFVDKKTLIYVCTGKECKQPVETVEDVLKQLQSS